jgi:BirA family biotin operon repressor/biotin-[acetyl-CoA-carboxylase] ligase
VPSPFDEPQALSALRGPATSWTIDFHGEVASTMDLARDAVAVGAPAGTVVVADSQSAGRGRLGRYWVSPPGVNLYLTVVLRPSLALLRQLAMLVPLSVAEAIDDVTGLHAEIKWPNDVQLGGFKCVGVLIDSQIQGENSALAFVGIGIDVNQRPESAPELKGIATSIAAALGRDVNREALLAAVLNRLAALCTAVEAGEVVRERWKVRLNTLGRAVRVRSGDSVETGVAEDVDEDGSLRLRRADGSLVVIAAGEVTLRARTDAVAPRFWQRLE